jgi:hypothetical protein
MVVCVGGRDGISAEITRRRERWREELLLFIQKCAENSVRRAGVLAVSRRQGSLDTTQSRQFSAEHHITLETFIGWERFVREMLFWGERPVGDAITRAMRQIRVRLIEIEASEGAVKLWDDLTTAQECDGLSSK